eukprot:m.449044 g.449044  ORF g.449044 m.449044 type:complete len:67 (-) comp161611_c0_seq1:130-330(-)
MPHRGTPVPLPWAPQCVKRPRHPLPTPTFHPNPPISIPLKLVAKILLLPTDPATHCLTSSSQYVTP